MTWTSFSRIGLICLSALLATGMVSAAPRAWLPFDHIGIMHGLPQSQVYSIGQDARGYVWFGTLAGLARYNGREFRVWTSADGMHGNQIDALAAAGRGVWAGTTAGLCHIDDSVRCADVAALTGVPVRALATIGDTLWVATADGLLALDPVRLEVRNTLLTGVALTSLLPSGEALWAGTREGLVRVDPELATARTQARTAALPPITTLAMIDGEIWIGTERGLWRYAPGGAPALPESWAAELGARHISGIVRGVDGRVWIATYSGLYRIDPQAPSQVWRIEGLESDIVRSLRVDRQGVVWVGLDRGVARYVPTPISPFGERAGMLDDFVRALARDADGNLWIGTREGLQIAPLVDGWPQFDRATTLTPANGLPDARVYAIEFTAPDEAWLATNNGLARWRGKRGIVDVLGVEQGLPSERVRALRLDQSGRLWVGTERGVGWIEQGRVHRLTEPPLDRLYALNIRIDDDGRSWFATVEHGVVIRSADGEVRRVGFEHGLGDSAVWDLWPAADGSGMWAGANGGGLLKVRPDGTIARHYTTADGLSDNSIWSVLVDNDGAVWAYSTRGLSRVRDGEIVNYGLGDGLPHPEGVSTAVLRGPGEQLWFGSVGGLARVNPQPPALDPAPPPVVIEHVTAGARPLRENAELAPATSEISFEFAALDFRSRAGPEYRWRLQGLNEQWSDPARYRPVTYGKLPAGDYRFQVQARTDQGGWSAPPASFAFRIAAPWWRHPAAQIGLALLMLALVLVAMRWRERELRRRAQTLHGLVDERTEALREANARLQRIATTDPLTGLKNRRYLMEQIEADLALARRRGEGSAGRIAFLLLDLDGFKSINDDQGHLIGDAMLVQVARVLRRAVRDSDYVVRWGGDEFLIVARGVTPGESERLAERILDALARQRFDLPQGFNFIGCSGSIGICEFPFDEGFGWDLLVEIADAACYATKRSGGGGWQIIERGAVSPGDPIEFMRLLRGGVRNLERDGRIRVRCGVPFRTQRRK